MIESAGIAGKAGRAWRRLERDGLRGWLRYYLRRFGIQLVPYYYVQERLPADLPASLTALPEGFEFARFGEAEIAELGRLPANDETASEALMRQRLQAGYSCLGMKHRGSIVAYTWFSLDTTQTRLYPAVLQPNEAYLFNMYVEPGHRGHHLAVIMRYRCYEALRDLGRDTFYSVTITSNKPSWRFKQKLGAARLFLGLYLQLFRKFEGRWIVRRYQHSLP